MGFGNCGDLKYIKRDNVWTISTKNVELDAGKLEARSYRHWLFLKRINGRIVFNDYSYSNSTNSHQGAVLECLRDHFMIFRKDLVFVSQRESLDNGIVIDAEYKKMYLAEYRLKLKGRRAEFYKDQKQMIKESKQKIKELRSLGGKTIQSLNDIKSSVIETEISRIRKQREESIERREKLKAVKLANPQFKSLDAITI